MPTIQLMMASGRSEEQKRKLVKAVTEAVCSTIAVTPADVEIIILEVTADNLARGGQLVSDFEPTDGPASSATRRRPRARVRT
jgi:4-oxalocrotonate tautomerase